MTALPRVVTFRQVAEMTGLPLEMVRGWHYSNDLPAFKLRGRLVWYEVDVAEWLEKQHSSAGAA